MTSVPSNHWALQPLSLTDTSVIALAYFERSMYAVYMHPHDKRGYRSIVRLIDNDAMLSTLNRVYSTSERIGLALLMASVTESYTRILPIAQNMVAGNNAHKFDSIMRTIQLGTSEEPIFLHGHIVGRGDPDEHYIENIPLDGPVPGLIFDFRAQSLLESGNDKKVSWKSDDINTVTRRIKVEIDHIRKAYENQGLILITQHFSIDVYVIRHGETDWNIQRRIQGHTDIPLNMNGQQQVQELAKKLNGINFVRAISSDLSRAHVTAKQLLDSDGRIIIETSALLREQCFGKWEGCIISELPLQLRSMIDADYSTLDECLSSTWDNTIESYGEVYTRFKTIIRRLLISSSAMHGPILLSTHGGLIRSILYKWRFQAESHWKVQNCAILKLSVQADEQIIISWFDGITMLTRKEILL
jgi:2,3-bisphosphoglycerate-dependent phosphoglycerate mutase